MGTGKRVQLSSVIQSSLSSPSCLGGGSSGGIGPGAGALPEPVPCPSGVLDRSLLGVLPVVFTELLATPIGGLGGSLPCWRNLLTRQRCRQRASHPVPGEQKFTPYAQVPHSGLSQTYCLQAEHLPTKGPLPPHAQSLFAWQMPSRGPSSCCSVIVSASTVRTGTSHREKLTCQFLPPHFA